MCTADDSRETLKTKCTVLPWFLIRELNVDTVQCTIMRTMQSSRKAKQRNCSRIISCYCHFSRTHKRRYIPCSSNYSTNTQYLCGLLSGNRSDVQTSIAAFLMNMDLPKL